MIRSVRRAKIEEAQYLSDLAMRSKAIYNYPEGYLEKCRPALTITRRDIEKWSVVVFEEKNIVLGFFALMNVSGEDRLEHLWLEPEVTRAGVGRFIFTEIINEAQRLGWSSFRLVSDPEAKGFYEKMGAVVIGEIQSKIAPNIYLPHMEYFI